MKTVFGKFPRKDLIELVFDFQKAPHPKKEIVGKVFVFKNIEVEIHRNGFENLNKNYSHLQNSAHSSSSPLNFLSSQSGLIRWFFLTFEYSIVPDIRKIKVFLKFILLIFQASVPEIFYPRGHCRGSSPVLSRGAGCLFLFLNS